MSKLRVCPIDFDVQAGMVMANDPVLFAAVQRFSESHLVERPNYGGFKRCWAAMQLDGEGRLEEVVGVAGVRMVPDIALFRSIRQGATALLSQRVNDHFSDAGLRGKEVFLHVAADEAPEQRCAAFEDTMAFWNAVPANRQIIVVR